MYSNFTFASTSLNLMTKIKGGQKNYSSSIILWTTLMLAIYQVKHKVINTEQAKSYGSSKSSWDPNTARSWLIPASDQLN